MEWSYQESVLADVFIDNFIFSKSIRTLQNCETLIDGLYCQWNLCTEIKFSRKIHYFARYLLACSLNCLILQHFYKKLDHKQVALENSIMTYLSKYDHLPINISIKLPIINTKILSTATV